MQWLVEDGLVEYESAVLKMEQRVADIIVGDAEELVWLVEHPPLYTSGTSARAGDLLDKNMFPVYETGRGGEFTYHGPGQRVVYVMLNLKERKMQDLKAYVFMLEQWIIDSLLKCDIVGERRAGRVGIWVDCYGGEKKIAAIGVRVRKWVTFHGIAINIDPDLSHYSGIVPCGISEYGVTSCAELGKHFAMTEFDSILKDEFPSVWRDSVMR